MSLNSILEVCDVGLMVHLGCSEEERRTKQPVSFNIQLGFAEAPPAEKTDQLKDTVCYAQITNTLEEFLENRQYQLVESMALECLGILKEQLPKTLINLTLHKLHPPISQIKGGVKYTCGDFFA